MKIGVMGTGDVGKDLAKGFLALGHEVKLGGREANNEAAQAWAGEMGGRASAGTFADAVAFGEIIVLATLGTANEAAIRQAGIAGFRGKTLIDVTNPLDFSSGKPGLAISGHDSAGEQVQRLLPEAHVVKAFNTVGHPLMFKPNLPGGPPDMFICGNDAGAKQAVGKIVRDFGWEVIDLGGIESARYLEALCMIWVIACAGANDFNRAFKMLRR